MPDPIIPLIKNISNVTGPFALFAFLSVVFYLLYRRTLHSEHGKNPLFEYLTRISPKVTRQNFFHLILSSMVIVLVTILLFFLVLFQFDDQTLILYYLAFATIMLSGFLFFTLRLTNNAIFAKKNSKPNQESIPQNTIDTQSIKTDTETNLKDSECISLYKQKSALQKSIFDLEEIAANFGMNVPPHIRRESEYLNEQLQLVEKRLKEKCQ